MKRQQAPKGLSKEARQLWTELRAEYSIEDAAGLALLNRLGESLDLLRSAQAALKKQGLTIRDQRGSMKPHPGTVIADKAHRQMCDALRLLRLDLEPK